MRGLPEVATGDDLPELLATACAAQGGQPGDVLIVAHKVVSKAEGRVVSLASIAPGGPAHQLAAETGKAPEFCELILAESRRIVRRRGGTLICETHHGLVCANAGIDRSNVAEGYAVLLPQDPDASARRIQSASSARLGGRVGVIVTDTHGRAFRRGLVNVAIGVAGFAPIVDRRGERDRGGRLLVGTDQAIADEMAAASGIYMTKDSGTPAVVASGVTTTAAPGSARELIRDPEDDLFRSQEPLC